ncbi:deoxyuridine 5'-triphosphate nucleotidohydrolase [Caerostris darwini]|uniref:Deoxyuridine 5'-triphosphate nucleotidohydrolase n=1 Tax=Caerostris darwini TaxID=1538125 RepID=A0AAV4T5G1_9ARAC|nr:deoxyuridine 5'-triphosphate nucleotidohydrolase [Caerostris darwini]
MFVLQPHSTYCVPSGTPYLTMTCQKTLFSLHVVAADAALPPELNLLSPTSTRKLNAGLMSINIYRDPEKSKFKRIKSEAQQQQHVSTAACFYRSSTACFYRSSTARFHRSSTARFHRSSTAAALSYLVSNETNQFLQVSGEMIGNISRPKIIYLQIPDMEPQPTHSNVGHSSKSTTTIDCPFFKLPETIQFSKVLDDPEGFRAVTPTNSFNSVGYDIYVPNYLPKDIIYYLEPGRQAIIDTGIVLEIPLDLPKHIRIAAMVKDKSSVVTRYQLAVEAGVIDPTYRGSVKVVVRNMSDKTVFLAKGMKLAQIVFQLHWCPTFEQVEYTDRGHKGSTTTDTEVRGTRGFGGDEFENVMHSCGSSAIEKTETNVQDTHKRNESMITTTIPD